MGGCVHAIYAGLILGTLGWALLRGSQLGLGLLVALFIFFGRDYSGAGHLRPVYSLSRLCRRPGQRSLKCP